MPPAAPFVSLGELSVADNIATIQIHSIAKLVCYGEFFCFAVNPIPVNIISSMPWDQRGLFLSMWGDPISPYFDALTIQYFGVVPFGFWRAGTFVYGGSAWKIHEHAIYSEYLVQQRAVPLVDYMLQPMYMLEE